MVSFVELPPEMRNSIYNILLTGPSPDLGVLRVSHSVHEETSSYFYQHNTFTVSFPSSDEANSAGADILPPISDKYIRHLKHLTIDILLSASHAQLEDCARRIDAVASSGAKFICLTLAFRSTASPLLSTRVDDTMLTASHPLTLALQRLLASEIARKVSVELQGVWFAPGVATALQAESEGRLDISTISSTLPSPPRPASGPGFGTVERDLVGCTTNSHLHAMGFDEEEVMDFQTSSPSSLSEVLEELDQFSPSEYSVSSDAEDKPEEEAEREVENTQDSASMKVKRADSFFDEDFIVVNETAGDMEEELTEADDVEDEEMLDVDDIEAILGNLGAVAEQRGAEREVCYLTNFAPEVLAGWLH